MLRFSFDVARLVSTTAPSYQIALPCADEESHGKNYLLGLNSVWTSTSHEHTKKNITGFQWDNRIWGDESTENWFQSVPQNFTASTSGIEDYFLSGIGATVDLELIGLDSSVSSGELVCRYYDPIVNHGTYFNRGEKNYLFADSSVVLLPTASGVTEVNSHNIECSHLPKASTPIEVRSFSWDFNNRKYIPEVWQKRTAFSGTETTYDTDTKTIYWDSIDRTVREFMVTTSGMELGIRNFPEIILNQQCSMPIGISNSGLFIEQMEVLGISDGSSNQIFHTEYSPIDSGNQVYIFSWLAFLDGFISPDSLASGLTDVGFVGGGPIPSGYFPDVIGSGNEWLSFREEIPCSGWAARIDHNLGTVAFPAIVPTAGESIGIAYRKTVQIEYEPSLTPNSTTFGSVITNPVYHPAGDGFIGLSNIDRVPSSISLVAETQFIESNVFGPVDINSEGVVLVAIVLDQNDDPLESEVVTFSVDNLIGSFSGSYSATSITDRNGEARIVLSVPSSIDDVSEIVTKSNYSVDNAPIYPGVTQTTSLVTTLQIEDLKNVVIFSVYTDDASVGWIDHTTGYSDTEQELAYYSQYLTALGITGPTGTPVSEYIAGKTFEELFRDIHGLLKPVLFNGSNGRKQLVVVWDSTTLNPHTFSSGALVPMTPLDIVSSGGTNEVIFDTSTVTLPSPDGSDPVTPTGNLYGYLLVCPTRSSITASMVDSSRGVNISSVQIDIKLSIPDSMNGVWILDEINQIHIDEISALLFGIAANGQKVPLGFRLPSSNITFASALGGITFLDNNVVYNSNQWDGSVTPLRLRFEVI